MLRLLQPAGPRYCYVIPGWESNTRDGGGAIMAGDSSSQAGRPDGNVKRCPGPGKAQPRLAAIASKKPCMSTTVSRSGSRVLPFRSPVMVPWATVSISAFFSAAA